MKKITEQELTILQGDVETPLRVLSVANPTDLEVLQKKCDEVEPTDSNLKLLISRMYTTVLDENQKGVGIAAPQIGINKRVFLAQRLDKEGHPFEFFVNPEIIWYSKVQRLGEEGCLSIPDLYKPVMRSLVIHITYFGLDGQHYHEVIEGYTAVIMQHEFDHLNGVLFPDRIEEQTQNDYFDASPQVTLMYKK